MKKKINVIVLKSKLNSITKGSIINVSRGYALNYLIPNKLAEVATQGKIKQIEMFQTIKDKREKTKNINESLCEANLKKINRICVYKKKGEKNLIFGSVTEKDIRSWIDKYSNLDTKKIQIKVSETKLIGQGNVEITITSKRHIIIQLYLVPINI
uniref:50S ribosomal protein L9, chloroplastic n=1 Tax=Polysiphonia scopulorum TaxID=257860 RepID=A0A1Z1MI09_9FLOR|nr:ribosomal protein L9 [Polysiphonia scopulorum]ARW65673.1 ribosomal protein L9 [Polysiphonia scopulorum]